jgi:PIN domain nuclease of toxin-antitoxin system
MAVKILADTNLFIHFCRRLPLPAVVEQMLVDAKTERCISAISIVELFRLWQKGIVPKNPDEWLDLALESWTVFAINTPVARLSVLWDWPHRDPADRLIAATAKIENVELWHTDTILKKFTGFPQRYFVNRFAIKN